LALYRLTAKNDILQYIMSDAEGWHCRPTHTDIDPQRRHQPPSARIYAGRCLLALAATHAKRHINILVSSERLFLARALLLKVSLRFGLRIDWDLKPFLRWIVSTLAFASPIT